MIIIFIIISIKNVVACSQWLLDLKLPQALFLVHQTNTFV